LNSNIEISIVIVNYNTSEYLCNCLISVIDKLYAVSYEIIVVDNNSTERNVEILVLKFPGVKFLFRDVNDGFGSGCNFGAKTAKGKNLLFLNPDIRLLDDSVIKLCQYIDEHPSCGIVSGLMVDENNSVLYSFNEYPSIGWEFYQLIGFGFDKRISKLVNKSEIKENKIFETDWFHGAIFMISKVDFESTNGFNEKYFMYYEDVEICYNVKMNLGKKIMCLPSIRVFHHTQSSLAAEINDNVYIFHIHRSKIIFLRKYSKMKKIIFHIMGIFYVSSRITILPFWNKYKGNKKNKLDQLLKILKLYLFSSYVNRSKYEYIK
jgi:GT2 family glycosyltransferase